MTFMKQKETEIIGEFVDISVGRRCLEKYNRSILRYTGILCSFVFIIVAVLFFRDYRHGAPLELAIETSIMSRIALSSPILICVPLLIDLTLDGYFNSRHGIYLRERLLMLTGFVLPPLCYFSLTYKNYNPRIVAYVVGTLYTAQLPFNAGIMHSLVATSTVKDKRVFASLFWTLIALSVGLTVGFLRSFLPVNLGLDVVFWISIGFYAVGFMDFIYRYIRAYQALDVVPVEEMLPLSMTIVLVISTIGLSVCPIFLGQYSFLAATINSLYYTCILNSLKYIFAILLPGRCSRNLMQETQRTIDSKRAFIRYISHEIRTPANICGVGMGLVAEQLKEMGVFVGDMKEIVSQVQESMFSIAEILNNLLEFENVDSNSLELNLVEVSPLEFVRNTVRLLEMQANQNGLHFLMPTSHDPSYGSLANCTVEVDVFKMGQALRNFVSNAIRFTPIGGNIAMSLEPFSFQQSYPDGSDRSEAWVRINVTDSGEGISKIALQKLRDEGIQFDHSHLEPGQASGLSLFISKSIVHKHGGHVIVDSKGVGCGSVFSIELPLISARRSSVHSERSVNKAIQSKIGMKDEMLFSARRRSSASLVSPYTQPKIVPCINECGNDDIEKGSVNEIASNSAKSVSLHPPVCNSSVLPPVKIPISGAPTMSIVSSLLLTGRRILCVDDSLVNLKMVMMLLKKLGATCEQATDGKMALTMVQQSIAASDAYDFVMMDNFMPEMCGPEACTLMRAAGYSNPIFGLTGHVLEVDMREYSRAGANHIFKKPLNLSEFRDIATSLQVAKCISPKTESPTSEPDQIVRNDVAEQAVASDIFAMAYGFGI